LTASKQWLSADEQRGEQESLMKPQRFSQRTPKQKPKFHCQKVVELVLH
jgi:hypothetical protein